MVFDKVSFSYGKGVEEQVLNEVSLALARRSYRWLAPSGSGKSTCSKLAARFWDPSDGRVLVGGIDISAVDPLKCC